MDDRRLTWIARAALALFTLAGVLWLARLHGPSKIATNILELIPNDQESRELAVVRAITSSRQSRVVLIALRHDHGQPPTDAVVERFLVSLRGSAAFAEVLAMRDQEPRRALGKFVFERRFDLLLPAWLAERDRAFQTTGLIADERVGWLASRVVDSLQTFADQPEATAFQDLIPADPLLLIPRFVERLEGLAEPGANAGPRALIWARLAVSPFEEAGQAPVVAALQEAWRQAQAIDPAVQLQWSGINRFAAASRERAEGEMSRLNVLSLVGVLAIGIAFVRRPWQAFHLAPVVLLSLLGAWVTVTLAFERVHILVFVIGALLIGVAIDYGFYLFLQPPLYPGEPYKRKVGRLLRPLLTSCLTTVLGFLFLLFSELPIIRQLGVFVSGGLIAALGAALLYFAQIRSHHMEVRPFALVRAPTGWHRYRGLGWVVGALAGVFVLLGLQRLSWKDDIRALEVPSPSLQANDRELREWFGETRDRTLLLTRGHSPASARESLAQLQEWLAQHSPSASVVSIGQLLPREPEYLGMPVHLANLSGFEAALRSELTEHGFVPEAFDAFFDAWRDHTQRTILPSYPRVAEDLQSALHGPLDLAMQSDAANTVFATIVQGLPPNLDVPAELDTISVDQLQRLNQLFERYRRNAAWWSAAGLALVGLSVFVLYGLRKGFHIFLIPCGACLVAFALLGWSGHALNLFHVLGAFLGVCLSHNYAIFSAENAGRGEAPPISIRLSGLTTLVSFGVLATSSIPVVAALGVSVSLIVALALLLVELEVWRVPADAS